MTGGRKQAEAGAGEGERYVIPLRDATLDDLELVGGKNASLGEMLRELAGAGALEGDRSGEPAAEGEDRTQGTSAGVRVADGFATTVAAFRLHLDEAGLANRIYDQLDGLDVDDTDALAETGASIRRQVVEAELPEAVSAAIGQAYAQLCREVGREAVDVAVRSSATAEDLPSASFAGQQETYLNVSGERDLLAAVRRCMASLFTDRAIVYRSHHEIPHRDVGLSVGVQRMVRSDLACAGVIFTLDTESGFRDVVLVTGAWGLGETVVQGRVNPDELMVHKPTARAGFRSIIRRELGDKRLKLVYAEGGSKPVREVRVSRADRARFILDDAEVMQLARWAMAIEDHYSERAGKPVPMDLEWAKDGQTGELFVLQARPETVHAQQPTGHVDVFKLRERGKVLVKGKAVGNRIGAGRARVVRSVERLDRIESGDVIVAEMTDPDWEPVLKRAAAVVTNHGGRTCHAAIVSRELGLPCIVGAGTATEDIEDGADVTVSCAEGDAGFVYEGRLEYDKTEIDPSDLPEPRVPLMLNVANPDGAFNLGWLPSAGVGLMRLEFVITNWIGVHPMALVHPEGVESARERRAIEARTEGYDDPRSYFVERLALGIAPIAAAFYPRPVIVRFSDFKTNEYAGLLGGSAFEPEEANPMIGFRGASRYYDDAYSEGFGLECAAIHKVRDEMGLTNVKVMVPFCRTLREAERVLEAMALHGLERGDIEGGSGVPKAGGDAATEDADRLEVWMMCEIPSNALLAGDFARLFDGFSIGSNDLTQLTLGVDRDSELLAHLFDESDAAVKALIAITVEKAHAAGRRVGICGEAPSNSADFAAWLADIGIDSISLSADALPGVAKRLA